MSEPVHYYCDGRVLMRDGTVLQLTRPEHSQHPATAPILGDISLELDDLLGIPFACRGCQHFEGGPNAFVCAMHPLGVEAETCPDFESERYFESAIAVATSETYELRGRSR